MKLTKYTLIFHVSGLMNILMIFGLLLSTSLSVSAQEGPGYSADNKRLETKANRSKELYVEPGFNFETFKVVTLDLAVTDQDGHPTSGAMLSISAVPRNVESLDDQRLEQKSLMTMARTDVFGRIYQKIEVSNSVQTVLVELNVQRPNNKVLVNLTKTHHINHLFDVE